MNISFCITSDLSNEANTRINSTIISIENMKIPQYEIIIISEKYTNTYDNKYRIKYIKFNDSTESKKWITRKKNILVKSAQNDIIVMMHDYFIFDKDWYKNFLLFGQDWDICSNAQKLQNTSRHWLDWTVWDDPQHERYTGLCYDNWSRTKYMYISGAYYLIKTNIAIDNPLDESLVWGQAEDVEWSLRIRERYIIKCNGSSIVTHSKSHRDLSYKKFKFEKCYK